MEDTTFKVQFLKNGNVLDTMETNCTNIEEVERKIPEMKSVSWNSEVNRAESIEWKIVKTVKEGTI